MCGFVGIADYNNGLQKELAIQALQVIAHRGPDAQNYWTDNRCLFLGHNRLSIIDLDERAGQPMHSPCGEVSIVFNGEIYNYVELRRTLRFSTFRTSSDTEVLLHGYLERGDAFFQDLRGIYAFGILDRRHGRTRVILGRDPSGVKPLYFLCDEGKSQLFFGSEIKSIKVAFQGNLCLNEIALKQYVHLGFIPEPQTVWQNVRALRPGHMLTWEPGKATRERSFFNFSYDIFNDNSFEQNLQEVEHRLITAVKRNLIADVPVSIALSGGIDSSLIYYHAIREDPSVTGVTVSFPRENAYDESALSAQYAEQIGGNHQIILLEIDLDLNTLDRIFLHFDQPYADSSAIPVHFLNEAARTMGKVLIGGDGGDELFNGYPSQSWLAFFYRWMYIPGVVPLLHVLKHILPGERSRQSRRLLGLLREGEGPFAILFNRHSWFPITTQFCGKNVFRYPSGQIYEHYAQLFEDEVPQTFEGKIVFDYFRKIMLSDYLRKTDMMSMYHGVEWRVPLLDEDLARFAFSIPFKQKSGLKTSKKFLRALHREIYPPHTSHAPKSGFSIPLDRYLSKEDKNRMGATILKKESIIREWVSEDYLQFLVDEFHVFRSNAVISRAAVYQRVLILYNLQRWMETQ